MVDDQQRGRDVGGRPLVDAVLEAERLVGAPGLARDDALQEAGDPGPEEASPPAPSPAGEGDGGQSQRVGMTSGRLLWARASRSEGSAWAVRAASGRRLSRQVSVSALTVAVSGPACSKVSRAWSQVPSRAPTSAPNVSCLALAVASVRGRGPRGRPGARASRSGRPGWPAAPPAGRADRRHRCASGRRRGCTGTRPGGRAWCRWRPAARRSGPGRRRPGPGSRTPSARPARRSRPSSTRSAIRTETGPPAPERLPRRRMRPAACRDAARTGPGRHGRSAGRPSPLPTQRASASRRTLRRVMTHCHRKRSRRRCRAGAYSAAAFPSTKLPSYRGGGGEATSASSP